MIAVALHAWFTQILLVVGFRTLPYSLVQWFLTFFRAESGNGAESEHEDIPDLEEVGGDEDGNESRDVPSEEHDASSEDP